METIHLSYLFEVYLIVYCKKYADIDFELKKEIHYIKQFFLEVVVALKRAVICYVFMTEKPISS